MKRIILLFLVLLSFSVSHAQENDLPALEYRRVVVAEELTATWCGYCPRGIVGMADMKAKYPDSFIGIAVHDYSYNYDPMGVRGYADGLYRYFTSLPKVLVNRQRSGDPFYNLESMYKQEMAEPVTSAVALSVSYADESKNILSATIRTKFAFAVEDARYAYAVVVLENEVKGTASGYAQTNNFSGKNDPIGNFGSLPSTVPASQMVYQDVARTIFPTFEGMEENLLSKFEKDEEISLTYDLEVPGNVVNKDNMEVVVLLIDSSTGEIVNAAKASVSDETTTASENVRVSNMEVTVYQDGSSILVDLKTVSSGKCSAELYNIQGQHLDTKLVRTNGPISFVPSNSGIYFVRVTDGKDTIVKKIVYQR